MANTKPLAEQVVFEQGGTGAVARTVQSKLAEAVSVFDFMTQAQIADVQSGSAALDHTDAIQAAIDSGAEHLFFPKGEYLVRRKTSVDGHTNYGLEINRDDLAISGVRGATKFKRYNPDISTYALAYCLFHIGSVEISDNSVSSNISIQNVDFYGNDTRHNVSGSSLGDFRYAFHVKSATNLLIQNCTFWEIDSSAIYFAAPRQYSYVTSTSLNTNTYSENAEISGCTFWGEPHTVTGRALLHAIVTAGVNGIRITNNEFSWCDDAVGGSGTYDIDAVDAPRKVATFVVPSGDDAGTYLRCGREQLISNNIVKNSSEHAFYMATQSTTISGNVLVVDSPYCKGDIKVRGQYITVVGNHVTANGTCIAVQELSQNVTVVGNTCFQVSDDSGGCINISCVDPVTYVNNRPWIDTSSGYPTTKNVVISNNICEMRDVVHTYGFGIRILTDTSTITQYPDGVLHDITISNNVFDNVKIGLMSYGVLIRNVKVHGNIFRGGSFTSAGFDGSDLKGYAAIGCANAYQYNLLYIEYVNNKSVGFKYVFGIVQTNGSPGGGQSGYYYRPTRVFQNNQFDYALDLSDGYGDGYWYTFNESSTGNKGTNLIARNAMMNTQAPTNSINIVGVSNSGKRGNFLFDGSILRYYYDDVGNFKTL